MHPLNMDIVCELSNIAIINVVIYMPIRITAHTIARICFIFFISSNGKTLCPYHLHIDLYPVWNYYIIL